MEITRSFRRSQDTTTADPEVSPKPVTTTITTATNAKYATATSRTTRAATNGDHGEELGVRQGLGVRQVRAHVPDQEVLGPALGAGQAQVPTVLQTVQAR